ncbi:histidine phosphatase family protein [Aliiroseovarius sp. 2305UL8-7]|uniref:histidine phosphatase family protein n=1 Tax=Aliiroseovarius conchicola TaxID=3121637 RepID=UPI003528C231
MLQRIRYLSHPQVQIDPAKDITDWSLSDLGQRRVTTLARSNALVGTTTIISSGETKAIETARPLADALGCKLTVRELMHENDRSSTGYLPRGEFEAVADQFFARPSESVRGWETALAAQARIVNEVDTCLSGHSLGDVFFVGHGAVGTLLFCHLSGLAIDRKFDQDPGGGGC